ncbi:MAG: sigma-70 family RNA polymerase sigma factor [Thermoanaerobaculia bacterium]
MTSAGLLVDFSDFLGAVERQPMSEADLVRDAQRGDTTAFEELYRQHVSKIYGLCLRMCANPAKAEDLTQEAFIRAWQKLGSFRRQSSFRTWLHRLTVNLVLGDLRSTGRWESRLTAIDSLPERGDGGGAKPETTFDLERAISQLPPQARMVFVLHDIEGYKHREIASLCNLAVGTSKAHLHRARKQLREVLKR